MYIISKKTLDKIRNDAGDPLFRMALTHAISVGLNNLTQDVIDEACAEMMNSEEKPMAIMTNEYKCEILKVSGEIAKLPPVDVEIYINREMEFSTHDDYIQRSRLEIILANTLIYLYETIEDQDEIIRILDKELGIDEDEIQQLGFGWMINKEDE